MPHVHQINLPTRAAIVTLRCEGYGWTEISEKLANCSPDGVRLFFNRTIKRAQLDPTNLSLPLLLEHLEDSTNRRHPKCFPEGSTVQEAL
ncbi:hypothetical protein K469DRAFT_709919, partial [Zopfia rhizophila CBS 207.26]